MNRILLRAIVFLVACVTIISCEEQVAPVIAGLFSSGEEFTIVATAADVPATKTAIQADGTSIYWTPNDAINLFYGNKSSGKFTTTISEPAAVADFTGKLTVATGSSETGHEVQNFWGVYPYNSANTCDGNSVTLTIPAQQTATEGTFADKLNPTVATSSNLGLAFYNVGSWFIFSVAQEGVTSATLRGNNNEDIAGRVRVTVDANHRPVAQVVEGAKSVLILSPTGESFIPGVPYYIVLRPQTLNQGYTLTLHKNDLQAECVVSKEAVFTRSSYRRKLYADQGLEYSEAGSNSVIAVDLGLPSGLKWASCNIGSENPEDVGDYYSWGEIAPKDNYCWSTYQWGGPSTADIQKYNDNDKLCVLESVDDIATLTLGGDWRTPTDAEFAELIDPDNCSCEWVSENNVNGYRITSKQNGNSIFLPTTGWWNETDNGITELVYSDEQGYYWSSQCRYTNGAFALYFNNQRIERNAYYRDDGMPIRPVKGDLIRAESIALNENNLELSEHSFFKLTSSIIPASATIQTVNWESSDNTVAMVRYGKVTTKQSGEVDITVSTVDNAVTASCHIRVCPYDYIAPEMIDLGLPSGTLWASFNLGSSSPEKPGVLFAWGELSPKDDYSYNNYRWQYDSWGYYEKYGRDGLTTLQSEDDAASSILGNGWRIPTIDQVRELQNEEYCTWTESNINGVTGFTVTSKNNGQSIFLPFISYVISYYDDGSIYKSSGDLNYWTADIYDDSAIFATSFIKGGITLSSRYGYCAIRPIYEP